MNEATHQTPALKVFTIGHSAGATQNYTVSTRI